MMSGFIGGEYGIAALRFAFVALDLPPNDPGFAIAPLSAFWDLSQGAVAFDDWAPEEKIRRRDALLPGV